MFRTGPSGMAVVLTLFRPRRGKNSFRQLASGGGTSLRPGARSGRTGSRYAA